VTELRRLINTKLAPTRLFEQRLSRASLYHRVGRSLDPLALRSENGTDSLPKRPAPRLRLLLIRPKPRPGIVTRGLRRKFDVVANIEGTEISRAVARLKFDPRFLRLVAGTNAVKLPVGSFQQRVSWTVETVEEVEETCVQVSVGAQIPQLAQFQLRILPIVRVK
jgi:hypothetical protein